MLVAITRLKKRTYKSMQKLKSIQLGLKLWDTTVLIIHDIERKVWNRIYQSWHNLFIRCVYQIYQPSLGVSYILLMCSCRSLPGCYWFTSVNKLLFSALVIRVCKADDFCWTQLFVTTRVSTSQKSYIILSLTESLLMS